MLLYLRTASHQLPTDEVVNLSGILALTLWWFFPVTGNLQGLSKRAPWEQYETKHVYWQHSHDFIAECEANPMALDDQLINLIDNAIHLLSKAFTFHFSDNPALNAQVPLFAHIPQIEARYLILLILGHHMHQHRNLLLVDLLKMLEVLDLAC